MNCNKVGIQRSERERVAEMLFCHSNRATQSEQDATAASARDLLALLVDRLEDGVVLINPDQTVAWMNRAMEGLFGVSGYETIGMNVVEFISHFISPNLQGGENLKSDFIVSCFFCENIPTRRYCITRTPAGRVWVEHSSIVIPGGPNRGARLDTYHISQDTDRPETNLQEGREQYELLAALSSHPIVSLDPGLTITSANLAAGRLLGYIPGDLIGKHLSFIMAPSSVVELQKTCFPDYVSSKTAGCPRPAGEVCTLEATLMDVRNQPVAVILEFSSVRDRDGNPTGIIAVAHQKGGEPDDEDLWREVGSQLDQNIERFVCLGDRIRNPLAVIIGLAGLEDDETARRIVEQARIIDGIVTELDRGYVASLSVRRFLRKHHHS